jgi:hypothetical protein
MSAIGAERKLTFEVRCFRFCPRPWENTGVQFARRKSFSISSI